MAALTTEHGVATTSSTNTTDTAGPTTSGGRGGNEGAGTAGGGGGDDGEFNTNFGEAVVCLREDLPDMFVRDMRWHIYREDVTFTLGTMGDARLTGLTKYKWLHRSVRALTWLLYSDVRLTTLRMWESQTERRHLRVRWCVLATPRLPAFVAGSEPMRFEAISTYKFDSRTGRIYEHSVDRLIPPESPVAKLIESFISWQGTAPAGQQPAGIPVPNGVPGGVSNPAGGRIESAYTFGHSHDPQKTAEQDKKAAAWWAPGNRPSTNDAANKVRRFAAVVCKLDAAAEAAALTADIEEFWQEANAAPGSSILHLTGRDTAVAVKQAGRGTHVTLGCEGNEFTRSSKYRDDFCNGGAAGAAAKGEASGPAAMYAQAKKAARANRALGTGASLSLAQQMW
ncbi:hypothetical protein MNEG_4027 [Monoraphidium neglectum]|uniref:Uncharacterized protein n=1 Tax=Monoraphidium neglectum TaxID=145388 RepID=A0A0D2MTV6_9CHLO|nr:hypothetical protein MNEG_4027 [Monoraphidium neglectum]KIZ03927.1 hypothetical protein MNEG_4027 [Monoraphidium neglectum]|eukprot:XP_013902946.1 hypothetical protein MNEG_4027 [Monoraphidium neglectum]